ncbi:DUF1801 domain-containing protein [Chitinophaga lutea]|uniref:DUF1801 domain-containing protein n=1 Tax=Chitinophaga lutea TaxID=2488634 RepID=A0A3N4PKI5_9BACT|nr:DUF1801 domain-containing protein [Chitinophaga lutea]RPE09192.1 DUF1801 domain-containing protein [Chitinophaga lutea]
MATSKNNIKNVDEYLATLSPAQKEHVKKIRQLIINVSAELEEGLTYSTPAYRVKGKLVVGIAAAKTHTGFYVMSETVIEQFKDKLRDYELAKTSFKIPLSKTISATLVKQIVLARINENSSTPLKTPAKK